MEYKRFEEKINKARGTRAYIRKELRNTKKELQKIRKRKTAIEKTQTLLQNIATKMQNKIKYHITEIVQMCLDAVFPEEYLFKIFFENKNGGTIAKFKLIDFHGNENHIMDMVGGGIIDIVSLGLRLSALILAGNRKTIILDEPFKFLSSNFQPIIEEMIIRLSEKLGVQIIMVTERKNIFHGSAKIFCVKKNKSGVSKIN